MSRVVYVILEWRYQQEVTELKRALLDINALPEIGSGPLAIHLGDWPWQRTHLLFSNPTWRFEQDRVMPRGGKHQTGITVPMPSRTFSVAYFSSSFCGVTRWAVSQFSHTFIPVFGCHWKKRRFREQVTKQPPESLSQSKSECHLWS